MRSGLWLAVLRGLAGVATLGAATVQLILFRAFLGETFLMLLFASVLLAGALLAVGAVRWRAPRSHTMDSVRGAAVVYLSASFIAFTMGFAQTPDAGFARADTFLFQVMPIVIIVDWLIDPPRGRLATRVLVPWMVFPALWLVLALVMNDFGIAPYSVIFAASAFVLFAVLGTITLIVGNALGKRRTAQVQA